MSLNPLWCLPPVEWRLDDDEVHIWRVSLGTLRDDQFEVLRRTLATDEVLRAERFRFQHDRERFVIARGTLRMLLGRYLDYDPQALRFVYNPFGKPLLRDGPGRPNLSFNVSHASDLALFAVARHRALGIDIERIRGDLEFEQIASRYFSHREQAALRALPPAQRVEGFFNIWTRKEAYIKARGEGLSLALDKFDVSLASGDQAALLETRDDPLHVHRWTLRQVWPAPGHVAALACEGRDWRLSCWQWHQ